MFLFTYSLILNRFSTFGMINYHVLSDSCIVLILFCIPRWATDDPNPKAKAEYKRKAEALAAQAIQKSLPAEFALGEYDYENKRPRIAENIDQVSSEDFQNLSNTQTQGYREQQVKNEHFELQQESAVPLLIPTVNSKGAILSQETLETLKSLSRMNRHVNLSAPNVSQEKKETTTGKSLGGLVDYGSDDESESGVQEDEESNPKNSSSTLTKEEPPVQKITQNEMTKDVALQDTSIVENEGEVKKKGPTRKKGTRAKRGRKL